MSKTQDEIITISIVSTAVGLGFLLFFFIGCASNNWLPVADKNHALKPLSQVRFVPV
jgi:hypothetical protein